MIKNAIFLLTSFAPFCFFFFGQPTFKGCKIMNSFWPVTNNFFFNFVTEQSMSSHFCTDHYTFKVITCSITTTAAHNSLWTLVYVLQKKFSFFFQIQHLDFYFLQIFFCENLAKNHCLHHFNFIYCLYATHFKQ